MGCITKTAWTNYSHAIPLQAGYIRWIQAGYIRWIQVIKVIVIFAVYQFV